jgi:threonine dehydratase
MFKLKQLEHAHAIVAAAMPPTPARAWPLLSERLGATAVVKHENHTPTGAFKVRGGLVYVDRLNRERPGTPGLISATTGNHGGGNIDLGLFKRWILADAAPVAGEKALA